MTTTHTNRTQDLITELETLAGEIRVKLHLAGMEANDLWNRELEPRLTAAKSSTSA